MLLRLFFMIFIVCLASCKGGKDEPQSGKFDKAKWAEKKGPDHPNRPAMLHDLVYNVKLKGLKEAEVKELLGQPDRYQDGHLYYRIEEKRMGSFIMSTKTLVIKINSDTVEWRKIHGG